jgi:hypothetical protein
MNHTGLLKGFRLTGFTFVVLVVSTIFVFSIPSFATKGRDAVGMCIDSTASGARCVWSVNDKGEIDICNKYGCITCPSADSDCKIVSSSRPRPHPKGVLPVGTKVETSLGSFEVKRRAIPPLFGIEVKKKPSKENTD